jgi:hypothetical protein
MVRKKVEKKQCDLYAECTAGGMSCYEDNIDYMNGGKGSKECVKCFCRTCDKGKCPPSQIGKPKPIEKVSSYDVILPKDWLWDMVMSTVRYSMGRRSGIVASVRDIVQWCKVNNHLQEWQLKQIAEEIMKELERTRKEVTYLGDKCDDEIWREIVSIIIGHPIDPTLTVAWVIIMIKKKGEIVIQWREKEVYVTGRTLAGFKLGETHSGNHYFGLIYNEMGTRIMERKGRTKKEFFERYTSGDIIYTHMRYKKRKNKKGEEHLVLHKDLKFANNLKAACAILADVIGECRTRDIKNGLQEGMQLVDVSHIWNRGRSHAKAEEESEEED